MQYTNALNVHLDLGLYRHHMADLWAPKSLECVQELLATVIRAMLPELEVFAGFRGYRLILILHRCVLM